MYESDEALYHRYMATGDETDLRALWDRYIDSLTMFLYGYVGSMDEAEEIAIDAFAEIATTRSPFRGKSSFKTWFFTIGRNMALRYMHRSRRPFLLDRILPGSGESPEVRLLREERDRQLHRAMDQLNPDYRQVLQLVYFDGLSHEETAKCMERNINQIYKLANRGRAALKVALERVGFEDAHE